MEGQNIPTKFSFHSLFRKYLKPIKLSVHQAKGNILQEINRAKCQGFGELYANFFQKHIYRIIR